MKLKMKPVALAVARFFLAPLYEYYMDPKNGLIKCYREYAVPESNVTVTNSTDLAQVFVNVGTTAALEFLRMWASQAANATSAQQTVAIRTQATAFPTLTSKTPQKMKSGDPSSVITGGTAGAAGTSGVNASVAGAGTKTDILYDDFNVLNGWLWVATPGDTIGLKPSDSVGVGLYFPTAPATLTNWSSGAIFREQG